MAFFSCVTYQTKRGETNRANGDRMWTGLKCASALILLIPAAVLAGDEAEPGPNNKAALNLICGGAGSATRQNNARLFGDGESWSGVVGQRDVAFQDQVSLWVDGARGSLRMPRSMLPPVRGGKDGWFQLKDVQQSDSEITATVAVSIINKPKLRLDRYTGAVSISGKSGDYSGTCQKFDPGTVERAF